MRKTMFLLFLMLCLSAGGLFAVDYIEPPFMPMSPVVIAQGGGMVATAHGYSALFTNPAGFSRPGGELTLESTSLWMYIRPDRVVDLVNGLQGGSSGPEAGTALIQLLNNQLTTGGFGGGSAMGAGFAGNGLGLGAMIIIDSYLWGPTMLGVTGDLTATAGFVGGFAMPVQLLGMTIHIGGDIRPMVRIHVPMPNDVALGMISAITTQGDMLAALNSANAFHGVGIAFDLGAIAELGPFSFGISARDLFGTRFMYSQSPFGELMASWSATQNLPEGTPVAPDTYRIPMDVSVGAAFHPDLGVLRFIVDPTVHVDLQDFVGVIRDHRTPWTLLHIGGEAKLLSVFALRGGFNQGYITLGAGVHLLFLDANFALFTRELGAHLGDRPNSGATMEVAVRF